MKMLILLIFLLLLVLFIIYYISYSNINLYNTIYLDSDNNYVVVLEKNLLNTTITYYFNKPATIPTISFLTNYHIYYNNGNY